MNLSKHSKERFNETFKYYMVDEEYYRPIYNYLVYGLGPGSFWTSVFANDFINAMMTSHQGNKIPNLKTVAQWIYFKMPDPAFGSYDAVNQWLNMPEDERRSFLEKKELIYTPEKETWMILQDDTYEQN